MDFDFYARGSGGGDDVENRGDDGAAFPCVPSVADDILPFVPPRPRRGSDIWDDDFLSGVNSSRLGMVTGGILVS